MGKIKYLIFIVCFFAACTKKTSDTSPSIVGHWEWVKSTGGLANVNLTPQNTGRSWALTFNSDLTCIQTGDFRSNQTGAFTLTEQIILSERIQWINITFNGRIENYSYSFISRDTLRLDENLDVDGLSNFFVKR